MDTGAILVQKVKNRNEPPKMPQDPSNKTTPRDRTKYVIELVGWVIFVLSALCFVMASIGDPWSMAGSLLFLLACIVFLIPVLRRRP